MQVYCNSTAAVSMCILVHVRDYPSWYFSSSAMKNCVVLRTLQLPPVLCRMLFNAAPLRNQIAVLFQASVELARARELAKDKQRSIESSGRLQPQAGLAADSASMTSMQPGCSASLPAARTSSTSQASLQAAQPQRRTLPPAAAVPADPARSSIANKVPKPMTLSPPSETALLSFVLLAQSV